MPAVPAVKKPKPRPKTGGRKPGSKNKTTLEARALAQQYAGDAMLTLVGLMTHAQSDSARIAACNSILDRAYGKPSQAVQVIEMRPNFSGWSKDRLAAYHGLPVEEYRAIEDDIQASF